MNEININFVNFIQRSKVFVVGQFRGHERSECPEKFPETQTAATNEIYKINILSFMSLGIFVKDKKKFGTSTGVLVLPPVECRSSKNSRIIEKKKRKLF